MNIFISWSGERSKAAANALKNWLSVVLTQVDTWMSEHDIKAGSRWHSELDNVLEKSNFGIICLTPENQTAPWLLYEAGVLGKVSNIAKVIPFRIGLSATDVEYPLAQFQGVNADREGTLKLIQSINEAGSLSIAEENLVKIFDKWWPDLGREISSIPAPTTKKKSTRSDRDLLEEILQLLRSQSNNNVNIRSFVEQIALDIYSNLDNEHDDEMITFILDTKPIFGIRGSIGKLMVKYNISVSGFLDSVYDYLNQQRNIPAYTYGQVWMLKDAKSGKLFDDIGIEYCKTRGAVEDNRPIESVGLSHGIKLKVISTKQTKSRKF